MCSLCVPQKLDRVMKMFAPRSVLDVGCGTGQSLDYFLEHGVDALGIEGSALARSHAKRPERIVPHDLNRTVNLGRKFDLVWCFEVAEHIHPTYVHAFMETVTYHSDRVVLSAAPPGQGGAGHLNEQPPEWWIAQFALRGFKLDNEATAQLQAVVELHSNNVLVFFRQESQAS